MAILQTVTLCLNGGRVLHLASLSCSTHSALLQVNHIYATHHSGLLHVARANASVGSAPFGLILWNMPDAGVIGHPATKAPQDSSRDD